MKVNRKEINGNFEPKTFDKETQRIKEVGVDFFDVEVLKFSEEERISIRKMLEWAKSLGFEENE